jgi:uncharacterized protein (DUF1330 family)
VKKGYWVVAYHSVSDDEALRAYGVLATAALAAHGGKPIVRTADAVEPREAGLKQRTVVIEFESFASALETYESEEYKEALKALGGTAVRDFRIVEGA